jgi:hypothetical protein
MAAAADPMVVEAFERIAAPVVRLAGVSAADQHSPPSGSLDESE